MGLRLFLTAFGTGVFLVLFVIITATTFFKSEPGSSLTSTPVTSGQATPTSQVEADVAASPGPPATQQLQAQESIEFLEPTPTAPAPSEPSPTAIPTLEPAPGIPVPPSGLTATHSPGQGVVLGWNPIDGAAYYNVYRSQVPGGGPGATYVAIGSSGAPTFLDATALPGQVYFYVVTASSSGIESDSSNEASIQVP